MDPKKRPRGLGGSDSAAAVGLSPWKSPLELYIEKTGEPIDIDNDAMYRGRLLEPAVRQMYCDATGRTVVTPDEVIVHPKHEFMFASLDGIASKEIVCEFKTSRIKSGWGDFGTSEIPIYYLCQVQHYLAVTGMDRADVACLFGDFEFGIYPIESDTEFQGLLIEREIEFWRMVETHTPPAPVTTNDIRLRWPKSTPITVTATDDELLAAAVLVACQDRIKDLEGVIDKAKALLQGKIKDAEAIEYAGEIIATWKSAKGATRFDAKRFQSENPELYEKYLYEAASQRRFLTKGKSKCIIKTMLSRMTEIPTCLFQPQAEATTDLLLSQEITD